MMVRKKHFLRTLIIFLQKRVYRFQCDQFSIFLNSVFRFVISESRRFFRVIAQSDDFHFLTLLRWDLKIEMGSRHDPGALHDPGARHDLAAGVSHHMYI